MDDGFLLKRIKSAFSHYGTFTIQTKVDDKQCHYQVLSRILFVYSKLFNGYAQGMNEIVKIIYYTFYNDKNEYMRNMAQSDTFYCFCILMTEMKDNFNFKLDKSDNQSEDLYRSVSLTKKIEFFNKLF